MDRVNAAAYWILLASAMWALVILLVPRRTIRFLLLPGFLTGFLWTYVLNYPAVNWFHLWNFHGSALTIGKVPVALALAWYGAIVVFYFFLFSYPRLQLILVAAGVLATAAVFESSVILKHLYPKHWTVLEASYLGLVSHVIALEVLRVFHPGRIDGPKMPPF